MMNILKLVRISAHVTALCLLAPLTLSAATDVVLFLSDTNLDSDSHPEINIMRPDGTDHRMIKTDYPVTSASINPDGNWIVYVTPTRKELRLVHVSSKREKVLVRLSHSTGPKGPTDVKWSPNGRFVVYTRYYPGDRNGIKIGLEVYDTRLRRFSVRRVLGSENIRSIGRRITVRRLLWSPDSKTFAVSLDMSNRFYTPISGWKGARFSIIYSRPAARPIRNIVVGESSDRELLDFISNTEVLTFGPDGGTSLLGSSLWRYNFVNNSNRRIFRVKTQSKISGLAVSPDKGFVSVDITHLTGSGGVEPWSSVTGTPRDAARKWQPNFATINLRTLAAAFASPLAGYSNTLTHFAVGSNFYTPSYEWRSLRSAAVFRPATCWGWNITLRGTPGNDRIVGTSGADVISTDGGDDFVVAGEGDDIICGGGGGDILSAGPGSDVVFGDIGTNQNQVSEFTDSGDDQLIGSSGDDILFGLDGDDRILGGKGNDVLSGGSGNDRLDGGPGSDQSVGGAGTDSCRRSVQTSECE